MVLFENLGGAVTSTAHYGREGRRNHVSWAIHPVTGVAMIQLDS